MNLRLKKIKIAVVTPGYKLYEFIQNMIEAEVCYVVAFVGWILLARAWFLSGMPISIGDWILTILFLVCSFVYIPTA